VDAHVHLYPDESTGAAAKAGYSIWEYGDDPGVVFDPGLGVLDELGDRYRRHGFDHAVVLQLFDVAAERARILDALAPGLSSQQRASALRDVDDRLLEAYLTANRWVVDTARAHPMLTAYVGIDPLVLSPPLLQEHLADMADRGAKGVKLHPVSQGFEPTDPRLDPLYEQCAALDLVVLSHSGPGHRHGASARPREFAAVMDAHPRLRLVLAHLGGAAFEESAALAGEYPQVAFDLSEIVEWVGAPNAPSRDHLSRIVARIGADRVMLGSDFPWYDPAAAADKVASLPGVGPLEAAALLGETAVSTLGLDK
jgi:predicted TIM-barrel fold metal-dependent hydrolase